MKRIFFAMLTLILAVNASVLAQTTSVPITGGRFFMQRGLSDTSNARIETAGFTAVSFVGDSNNSVWNFCSVSSIPAFCRAGTTFNVPTFPTVDIGFCSTCNPPQFPRGTFTINGTTYENAYFSGHFDFTTATFLVSPMLLARRKGSVTFRKPFAMTGRIQVCRTVNDPVCPKGDILYEGQMTGHGTLTVTTRIGFADWMPLPYLFAQRDSIEYQFEP